MAQAYTPGAAKSDLKEITRLLARGVDVNSCDYDGRTALHIAASEGLVRACMRRAGRVEAYVLHAQVDVAQMLLQANAAPNPVDRWGHTPLADAQRGGRKEVAAVIRAAGGLESAPPQLKQSRSTTRRSGLLR